METEDHSEFDREAIKDSRFIKEAAKDEDIILSGRSEREAGIEDRSLELANQMMENQREWVEAKKHELLSQYPDVSEEELLSNYNKGLKIFIRQRVRFFDKTGTAVKFDEAYLQDAISSYTF